MATAKNDIGGGDGRAQKSQKPVSFLVGWPGLSPDTVAAVAVVEHARTMYAFSKLSVADKVGRTFRPNYGQHEN